MAALLALMLLVPGPPPGSQPATPDSLARGRLIFESQCARCHGITGGGAMGPSLRRPTLARAPDDSAFALLLTNGLYERGMPPAWQLGPDEIRDVIGFVRSLGRMAGGKVTGDSARGESLYAGKGGCRTCHIVNGDGGSFGPELSQIGVMRGVEHLRQALVEPGATLPMGPQTNYLPGQYARYLPVRAVGVDGKEVAGVRVNEDRFTIQIRTQAGTLYSFRKSELRTLEKRFGESLMPSYTGVFSGAELNDVVAYLASLREGRTAPPAPRPVP